MTMREGSYERRKDYFKRYYQENKAKRLQYQNDRYAKMKKHFQEWKATLKCSVCGEDDVACLDFHHSNQEEKDDNVMRLLAKSVKSAVKELEKCVVVCANCHRKIHAYDIETDPAIHNLSEDLDNYIEDLR